MYKVAALYKFTEVLDSLSFHNEIRKKLKEFSIYGTILVGDEGINGSMVACSGGGLGSLSVPWGSRNFVISF